MDNTLYFAKVKEEAIIPQKRNEDAGYDIYACFDEDYILIKPLQTVLVPTGIASSFSDAYYMQIQERGSTGSKGLKYGCGVIDSGFRGEWNIVLTNVTDKYIVIAKKPLDAYKTTAKWRNKDVAIYQFGNEQIVCNWNDIALENERLDDDNRLIYYPYSKAIAQAIVHRVPSLDVKEISYEELRQIPSERGTGMLGSSNK